MNESRLRQLLRGAAIVIAVLAIVDPALTTSSSERETIGLIASSPRADSALIVRVRESLEGDFTVVPGPFNPADATIIVGDAIPDRHEELPGPAFAVSRSAPAPHVRIERLSAPRRVPLETRVAVQSTLVVRGARGRTLDVTLRDGDVAVARTSLRIAADPARLDVPLDFAPAIAGAAHLRIEASLAGGRPVVASADAIVNVTRDGWRVLFHDTRPSWASTFVRRVAERDARFAVSSRIGTTRGVASEAGRPARLDDRATLEGIDLVVVGAPDGLNANEVSALDAFMRRRGGSVVLLLDEGAKATAPVFANLVRAGEWRTRTGGDPLIVGDSALRAIELAWPSALPPGAEAIAVAKTDNAPIVWGTQVGAGRLVVSGALDAWRFRDASNSSFETFWRELLASEAARAMPPIDVRVTPSVVSPGDRVTLRATVRTPSIAAATPTGWIGEPLRVAVSSSARLWPGVNVGELVSEFRAPEREGSTDVRLISGRDTTIVPIVVSAGASIPRPDGSGALSAWVASTGGQTFTVDQLGQLGDAIRAAISPASRPTPWYPMRSPWWIVPFALLLSAEWWMRRRRGLA